MIQFELTTKGVKLIGPLDETFETKKIPVIHRPHIQIDFMNCPVFFVQQANRVGGSIGPTRKISTFFVPYFESTSDKEHHILLSCQDIIQGKAPSKELNGQLLELDISEERFFQFLKIQGP